MINSNNKKSRLSKEITSTKVDEDTVQDIQKKAPLSFLTGALSSGFFAWLSFLLSKKVVIYFALHSPSYTSPITQSIASAMKTLVIGMCFLATFTFSFIGLGLAIVFIRSFFSSICGRDD